MDFNFNVNHSGVRNYSYRAQNSTSAGKSNIGSKGIKGGNTLGGDMFVKLGPAEGSEENPKPKEKEAKTWQECLAEIQVEDYGTIGPRVYANRPDQALADLVRATWRWLMG